MTIPLGRRRLVLSLIPAPRLNRGPDLFAAVGATDAELARLGNLDQAATDRLRWQIMAGMRGSYRLP
jgi:hypothetical protein